MCTPWSSGRADVSILRLPLLLLRPTSPLAWLPSRLPFPLLYGPFWRVSRAVVAFPACFPGSRQLCWCGGRSWRSAPHMLLPVRRLGSPDVPVERLLCRGNVCSCSSSVLCHGAEHGTRVEEIIFWRSRCSSSGSASHLRRRAASVRTNCAFASLPR